MEKPKEILKLVVSSGAEETQNQALQVSIFRGFCHGDVRNLPCAHNALPCIQFHGELCSKGCKYTHIGTFTKDMEKWEKTAPGVEHWEKNHGGL